MFGCHVNREGIKAPAGARVSVVEYITAARISAEENAGLNMTAAAIFVAGPKHRNIILTQDDIREISTIPVTVVAHNTYSASPWTDESAIDCILQQVKVCDEAGIVGLVVHLPKSPIPVVISALKKIVERISSEVGETSEISRHGGGSCRIFLETPAVKPSCSYYETPEKIAELFREIRTIDPELKYFGICIDTAHLWTCGVDLSSKTAADAWLRDLTDLCMVGSVSSGHSTRSSEQTPRPPLIPANCIMFHLNDSERERGVGPDTHAALTQGKIWEAYAGNVGNSGLASFINFAIEYNNIVILERKPRELLIQDYRIIREFI